VKNYNPGGGGGGEEKMPGFQGPQAVPTRSSGEGTFERESKALRNE
jgi:hypothetical protein